MTRVSSSPNSFYVTTFEFSKDMAIDVNFNIYVIACSKFLQCTTSAVLKLESLTSHLLQQSEGF